MTSCPSEVGARLAVVRERVAAAARAAGREPASVTLVGVGKTQPADRLDAAWAAGLRDFGENYVQEWRGKAEALAARDLRWHFIGALQSNKVKYLVGRVHLVHSVDRASVLDEIATRSARVGLVTGVLIEVNVGNEETKSGCSEAELEALVARAAASPGVALRGLMGIPPFVAPEAARPYFRRLRQLRDDLRACHPALGDAFCELSMGMSSDLEVAIAEGATFVRVGTDLFGAR
jgi:pyridoxal phosphate enzyme (YggS family)